MLSFVVGTPVGSRRSVRSRSSRSECICKLLNYLVLLGHTSATAEGYDEDFEAKQKFRDGCVLIKPSPPRAGLDSESRS